MVTFKLGQTSLGEFFISCYRILFAKVWPMVSQIVAFGQRSNGEEIKVIPKYVRVRELTVEIVFRAMCMFRATENTSVQQRKLILRLRTVRFVRAFRSPGARARARTSATLPIRFTVVNCRHGTCIATTVRNVGGRGTSVLNSTR